MIDRELSILESVRLMCRVPGVYELRCLEYPLGDRWAKNMVGYFDDLDTLAEWAEIHDGKSRGVYVTLNPVHRDLLARVCNTVREAKKDESTGDKLVVRRIWLPIDFDPKREVKGISSTAEEHALMLARARDCRDWLAGQGFPAPLLADSGNGGHLLYAIDLPNDDAARALVQSVLAFLAAKFSDDAVSVDEVNYNAARIWKLYGTMAKKGDDTPERPHRRSRLLEVPDPLTVVPADLLSKIGRMAAGGGDNLGKPATMAALARTEEPRQRTPGMAPQEHTPVSAAFDMPAFLERHGLEVHREKKLDDGHLWELKHCLFDESHAAPDACVMVRDGKPCFKCFHNSCAKYGWKEFRAKLEGDQSRPAAPMAAVVPVNEDRKDGQPKGREGSDAKRLLAAALGHGEPFISPEEVAYIRRKDDARGEVFKAQSHSCKRWLARLARGLGFVASQKAIADTLLALEAACHDSGDVRKVHLRVARMPDAVYLDLADAEGRAVKVTPDGWDVIARPPVAFVRSPNMASLPVPERGGDWGEFRKLLNVADEEWPLVRGWMLDCLKGVGPYTVLLVGGEQGSAKSTLSKAVRQAIDPVHRAAARRLQRDEYELAIAAAKNAVLCFDNVSTLPQWLSDAIASLATGSGFAVRTLYSQDDETVYGDARPVCFNGIPDFAESADLLDRAIRVTCPRIPEERRMDEDEWEPAFAAARPRLLGLLLDCVSSGLRHLDDVDLPCPPRMARSARWIAACEMNLPEGEPGFIDAYERNRMDTNALAIDGSPTATALLEWMDSRKGRAWEGTAAQLHDELLGMITGLVAHSGSFPKAPNKLSGELRRLAPALARAGVEVSLGRSKRGSKVAVRRVTAGDDPGRGVTIQAAAAVPPAGVRAADSGGGDGRVSSPSSPIVTRIVTPQVLLAEGVYAKGDDGDDSLPYSSPSKEEGLEDGAGGQGARVCNLSSPSSPIVTCRLPGEGYCDYAVRLYPDTLTRDWNAVTAHWNTCGCGLVARKRERLDAMRAGGTAA